MKYLVTGGCGFIGSHLCDALVAKGHAVKVLDDLSTGKKENLPPGVTFIQGDITDADTVARAMRDIDGCFHLAAIASVELSRQQWERTHAVNLSGTVNIFAASARLPVPVPVIYASSAAVFGDNPDAPITETAATTPLTAYGADKLGCELHARVASHIHRVPTTGLRFFNVYGPRQDPSSPYSGVISIFSRRILDGSDIIIYGDGGQSRDFINVGDVVRHLIAAMEHVDLSAAVFNVCTGISTSVSELAEMIGDVAGKTVKRRNEPPRAGDIRLSLGNPSLAVTQLGVKAEIPLRQGLTALLAHEEK